MLPWLPVVRRTAWCRVLCPVWDNERSPGTEGDVSHHNFSRHMLHRVRAGKIRDMFNLFPADLFSLNFHQLEVVSRYRDPQLQVAENGLYLFIFISNLCRRWCLATYFIPNNRDLIWSKTIIVLGCKRINQPDSNSHFKWSRLHIT